MLGLLRGSFDPMRDSKRFDPALKPSLSFQILHSNIYRVLSTLCLLLALFGGYIWIICDFKDDPSNTILDAMMITISVLFVWEIVICSIGQRDYFKSFWMAMDVLGTLSMIFEISFIFGSAGKINQSQSVDAVLMRTARAAKLAARAGRLVKLTKLMTLCCAPRDDEDHQKQKDNKEQGMKAEMISRKLTHVLSTKVSFLTILLVLCLPLFSIGTYPETDMSMEMWASRLEWNYASAAKLNAQMQADAQKAGLAVPSNTTLEFTTQLRSFEKFYSGMNYAPYKITGFGEHVLVDAMSVYIPGESTLQKTAPNRKQNIIRQDISACELARPGCQNAALYFDFVDPGILHASLESGMIIFVIVVMGLVSYDVNHTVEQMVVVPIGRTLATLRAHASSFLAGFEKKAGTGDLEVTHEVEMDEIELLQNIFTKLANLTGIMTEKNEASQQEIKEMSQEQRGVMVDLLGLDASAAEYVDEFRETTDDLLGAGYEQIVDNPNVPSHLVNTWQLDFVGLTLPLRNETVLYFMFDTKFGKLAVRRHSEVPVFKQFFEAVMDGYSNQPYHNSTHACDVSHTVFRFLTESQCGQWVGTVEQYALLVAALCHDIGHQGRTNPFLMETRHELAITFNDNSPLENMHASTLFKICAQADKAIFQKLSGEDYKHARKVCISTILHTDLSKHFDMVKSLQQAYEVSSDIIEHQVTANPQALEGLGGSHIDKNYISEVFHKNCMLFLEMFLHLADVSNPLKPWAICKVWAWRVLDEFFAQGDEEKKLGIPVGMLNDRDHVSRPGSQHGFITFLVAPLVFGAVDLLPQLQQLSTQMASNLEEWLHLWIAETKPDSEAITKKSADISSIKDEALSRQTRFDHRGRLAHLHDAAVASMANVAATNFLGRFHHTGDIVGRQASK